ncbi:MAG TPA: NlpC/P60 family protein, partial [Denitromonas sp.]|nr:NlpC/P60 family protein [Denitromonas sp.]
RVIPTGSLQPGDLVFFNTQNRPYSHMGIYLGDGKFIHAPSSKGKVRVERMNNRYFAQRFDGARSLFSDG